MNYELRITVYEFRLILTPFPEFRHNKFQFLKKNYWRSIQGTISDLKYFIQKKKSRNIGTFYKLLSFIHISVPALISKIKVKETKISIEICHCDFITSQTYYKNGNSQRNLCFLNKYVAKTCFL